MSEENKDRSEGRDSIGAPGTDTGASAAEAESAGKAGADDEVVPVAAVPVPASTPGGRPNQEEILRRVEALAKDDDEADRIARREEARLLERRAQSKTGKRSGLEEAAAKRLAKIGAGGGAAPPKRVAAGSPGAPVTLIDKSTPIGAFLQRNAGVVRLVALVAVAAGLGLGGYTYWQHKQEVAASAGLATALLQQHGRLGDPAKDDDARVQDPTPVFKTADERREAALKAYQDVARKYPGTGPGILARLSEAALLLDKRDTDGAIAAYQEVRATALAQADAAVRGRALEGIGFAHELKAQITPASAPAELDAALAAFKDVAGIELDGFKELGQYHQARVLEVKGDKDKAKELLRAVYDRVTKPGEKNVFPYLAQASEDRLRALDPQALPAKSSLGAGGPGGQLSQEQLQRYIQMMQQQQQQGGGAPGGK